MSANDRQVGGDHYKTEGGKQHWDFFGARYWLGCATKYVTRHRFKGNPREDLEKSIHYFEKTMEDEDARNGRQWQSTSAIEIARFAEDKGLNPFETLSMYLALNYESEKQLNEARLLTIDLLERFTEVPDLYADAAKAMETTRPEAKNKILAAQYESPPDTKPFSIGNRVYVKGHTAKGTIADMGMEKGCWDIRFVDGTTLPNVDEKNLTHWRGAVAVAPSASVTKPEQKGDSVTKPEQVIIDGEASD